MFGLGSTADPWPIPKLVRLNFVTLNLAKLPKSLPILGHYFNFPEITEVNTFYAIQLRNR